MTQGKSVVPEPHSQDFYIEKSCHGEIPAKVTIYSLGRFMRGLVPLTQQHAVVLGVIFRGYFIHNSFHGELPAA